MHRLFKKQREPEARLELPLTIPSSAVYDIVVSERSNADKAIRVRVGDTVVLELHADGRLVVPGVDDSATRIRWRVEGMTSREANLLLVWHDLVQQQRDHALERVAALQERVTSLERDLRYARAEALSHEAPGPVL